MLCNVLSSALKFTYFSIFRFSLDMFISCFLVIMKKHPSCSVLAVKLIEGFRLLIKLQKTSPSHFSEDDIDECYVVFPTFKSYYSLAVFDSFIIHTLKKENGTFLKSNIMHIPNYNKHVSKSGYTNSLLWLIC